MYAIRSYYDTEMGLNPEPLKGLAGGRANFYFVADPDGYWVEVVRA